MNVPEAPGGMASTTLVANSQLVVELTASVVEPWHRVEPAGGNASTGVPVGVLGAVADAETDVEPLVFADDAAPLADFDVAALDEPAGAPPPLNQRMPPMTAMSTSTPRRIITPREPERFARDGPTGAGTT
jgi:hypothetical protein